MANQYDTNLKLQAIADAIGDTSSSGLIQALEDIADAVAGGGGGGSSTAGLVSDNFSETDTYDLGDYCIHNNTLYVCINAITTPGAWDLSDWQATNAGQELNSLNSALIKEAFGKTFDNISSYITTSTDPFSAPYSGWYYMHVNTGANSAAPFMRFGVHHGYLFEGYGPTGRYKYLTSPLVYIKQGQLMKAQREDDASSAELFCAKDS